MVYKLTSLRAYKLTRLQKGPSPIGNGPFGLRFRG